MATAKAPRACCEHLDRMAKLGDGYGVVLMLWCRTPSDFLIGCMPAGATRRASASHQPRSERDSITASRPKLSGTNYSMGPSCTAAAKASRGTECGWRNPERIEAGLCPIQHRQHAARQRLQNISSRGLNRIALSGPSACRPCSSGRQGRATCWSLCAVSASWGVMWSMQSHNHAGGTTLCSSSHPHIFQIL